VQLNWYPEVAESKQAVTTYEKNKVGRNEIIQDMINLPKIFQIESSSHQTE
jgi:hypothetical protein